MDHLHHLNRRSWLKQATAGALGMALLPHLSCKRENQTGAAKTLLLVSSWQTVNIGDIAHTPGVLAILEHYLPDVRVILWPNDIGTEEERMLRQRFPGLRIVWGGIDESGAPDRPELQEAFREADFMLHGSGPSIVGWRKLACWRQQTGKPYGVLGTTVEKPNETIADLLSGAEFVFTRETESLEELRRAGVNGPQTGFAPDGTFAFDIIDEKYGASYKERYGLRTGEYICVVSRLRYTPYQYIRQVGWSDEEVDRRMHLNEEKMEEDHAKAREAMIAWIEATGQKVVLCPEMTYQLRIMEPLLIDPLPEAYKPYVVRQRTYWLPSEAAAVYRDARAVISMECHSPIIAFAVGTPAFYLRQPQDTIKGQMWYDLGVPDWVFEIEETTGQQVAERLLSVHMDRAAADAYLSQAMDKVAGQYDKVMKEIEIPA